MRLNEVGYEGTCQVWATVGSPPSITSSSSSFLSSSFYPLCLQIVLEIQFISHTYIVIKVVFYIDF